MDIISVSKSKSMATDNNHIAPTCLPSMRACASNHFHPPPCQGMLRMHGDSYCGGRERRTKRHVRRTTTQDIQRNERRRKRLGHTYTGVEGNTIGMNALADARRVAAAKISFAMVGVERNIGIMEEAMMEARGGIVSPLVSLQD